MPPLPTIAALAALLLAGSPPGPAAIAAPSPASPEATMPRGTAEAPSTTAWTYTGTWYGKPTLTRLSFDVTVRNPSAAARWVVLPKRADEPIKGAARGVTVYELAGGAFLWRFEGLGGFWAVRLPAKAELRLRGLTLDAWWERAPATARLEVATASDVLIAGEPAAKWVGLEGASPTGGDFDAKIDAMRSKVAKFRQTEADASGSSPELPVTFVDAVPAPAEVKLDAKK